jgi:hypothetical protein
MKCPKCNDEMEEGLQLDASYGGVRKATWIKGTELPTIKISLLPPKVEITGERYYVTVHRCRACGFLESYAHEKA